MGQKIPDITEIGTFCRIYFQKIKTSNSSSKENHLADKRYTNFLNEHKLLVLQFVRQVALTFRNKQILSYKSIVSNNSRV